jgi:predicted glycoside hydrolase/deacetylase ChbG (UPF0249 family)
MPRLAPDGRLPSIGNVTAAALLGRLNLEEIAAEIGRQLDAFTEHFGYPPDHIDGHQHVHALPGVRDALFKALAPRGFAPGLLVRDPGDALYALAKRRRFTGKALALKALSHGFARAARGAGPQNEPYRPHYLTNLMFGGVSNFAAGSVEADFATTRQGDSIGGTEIFMCHPGHVDDELVAIDPVTVRREAEYTALKRGRFPRHWRPQRPVDGPPLDFRSLGPGYHLRVEA